MVDSRRLLQEALAAFTQMGTEGKPTYDQILNLYRPVHSLKGMASMVEDGRAMAKAFHTLEDRLPPLLPIGRNEEPVGEEWREAVAKTFTWTEAYLGLLEKKLELWHKLGADENENRGLLVRLEPSLGGQILWVPVTWVSGLYSPDEVRASRELVQLDHVGQPENATDGIGIELHGQTFVLWVQEIRTLCTRLEAVQNGQAITFKDWIATRGSQAA